MKLALFITALALPATPALAQIADPLAAHRLQMEQLRARTEAQAATAATLRAQTLIAGQQLEATTRNDGGVATALAADAAVRREAERQEDLRRREIDARDAAADLERRIRTPYVAPR